MSVMNLSCSFTLPSSDCTILIRKQLQVHRAVTKDGMDVAIKIQYPGVADSIGSDIENVKLLLDYTNLIPKGLYLERAMKVILFLIISAFTYLPGC